MGFFDKAKAFMGGKGMADVSITVIERQPAATATFPVTDSVLKGTMVIDVKQNCTLLATKYELWLYVKKDGVEHPNFVCSAKDPEPNTSYGEGCLIMPCELKAGQSIRQSWLVMDVDLAKVLANNGIHDPNAAVDNPNIRLQVKCIADVKGSPFDPSAEVDVRLVGG
ncbi:MAG: hypothetical protein IPK74_02520 [Deltaproteobacteria bacterium]|nr:hypothetical protein [Deltaproteobacteria bacterium]